MNKFIYIITVFFILVLILNSAYACDSSTTNGNVLEEETEKQSDDYEVALILACRKGDFEEVESLIDKGADVNEKDNNGWTALMHAAVLGHTEIVDILIDNNVDVNAKNNDDLANTALMVTIYRGYAEIAERLINNGVDISEEDLFSGINLVPWINNDYIEIAKMLIDNTEIVKMLICNGADVNEKDNNSWTALMYAAVLGRTEIIKALIDNGADVNVKDNDGRTALMYAVFDGRKKVVKILIDNGADVNAKDLEGLTPLIIALGGLEGYVSEVYPDIVETLISKGADVNAKDNDGRTALKIAIEYGNTEIMETLIDNGADVNVRYSAGKTALMIVSDPYIAKMLIDNGVDVNAKDNDGRTALMLAAGVGNNEIVEILLKNGVDVNSIDYYGITALIAAEENNHTDIANLLKEAGAQEHASTEEIYAQIALKSPMAQMYCATLDCLIRYDDEDFRQVYKYEGYIAIDINTLEISTEQEKEMIKEYFSKYQTPVIFESYKSLEEKGKTDKFGNIEGVLLVVEKTEIDKDKAIIDCHSLRSLECGLGLRCELRFKDGIWEVEEAEMTWIS